MSNMNELAAIIINYAKTVSVEARIDAENSHKEHCSQATISA